MTPSWYLRQCLNAAVMGGVPAVVLRLPPEDDWGRVRRILSESASRRFGKGIYRFTIDDRRNVWASLRKPPRYKIGT